MNTYQQQKSREKVVDRKHEEGKLKQETKEGLADKQKSSISPASASSSPSHEFSFTVSLQSSSNSIPDKTKTPPSNSMAIDLSPADDIFFHGHLLPLHLLSHLPVSPRCSTNSLDSFTLPIRELLDDSKPDKTCSSSNCRSKSDSNIRSSKNQSHNNIEAKRGQKSKSFSSFFGLTRWQKGRGVRETEEKEENIKHKKKKMRFDVSHVLKRYVRMVRSLLFFRGRRENNLHLHRQAYSFSGNLSLRNKKQELRGRTRGEYSAPASIRTSPTNSGLLVATTDFPSSTSDSSTMEELQAAIQAAIAHCKNSIEREDKFKC